MSKLTEALENNTELKEINSCLQGNIQGRINELLGYNILLAISGYIRMAATFGSIAAIKDTEEASKVATQFFQVLSRLINESQNEVTIPGTDRKAPDNKCILADDGCLHSFSITWCRAVMPNVYAEAVKKELEVISPTGPAYDSDNMILATERAERKLNLITKQQVDEDVYFRLNHQAPPTIGNPSPMVRYTCTIYGGLIYHGAGPENYTINLDTSGALWGIHT